MVGTYDFHDQWDIQAPLELCWKIISDSPDWQAWWPGLKSAVITNHDPGIAGSSVALTWRSKSGYHLHHEVTITEIEPSGTLHFRSAGDLVGYGSWQFVNGGSVTRMIIDWHVSTGKTWMNLLAPLLRPVFIHNHGALMKAGERGLNRYVAGKAG